MTVRIKSRLLLPLKRQGLPNAIAVSSTSIGDLPTPVDSQRTVGAQRFLDAAVLSVKSALVALDTVRNTRRTGGKLPRGRLTDAEEDLLRATVVFAGAGLDSALKQLVREALPSVAARNADADAKFRDFARSHLGGQELVVNIGHLTDVLLSDKKSAREALLDRYVQGLSGESLQSAMQVDNVCSALGLNEADLRKRLKRGETLDLMFRARNEMIHELDLLRGAKPGPGVRAKRIRTISETVKWAREALAVAQEIINRVGRDLGA